MVTDPSGNVPVNVKKPWIEFPEALLLVGIAFVVFGVWMIYHPAALILFGLACISLALNIFGYFRRRDRETNGITG